MAKFKKGDIVERITKLFEKYRVVDIRDNWYHLESLQTGALHVALIREVERFLHVQQALFNIGDKLRYKIALIDLTFEVIALEDGSYVLKSSEGERVSADFSNVHEVLEVFEK